MNEPLRIVCVGGGLGAPTVMAGLRVYYARHHRDHRRDRAERVARALIALLDERRRPALRAL